MKALVCGGRDYHMFDKVCHVLDMLKITELIVGDAAGADSCARIWAQERNISYTVYTADWATHGRAAGPIRNAEMIKQNPSVVIAFPGGRGTQSTIGLARQADILVLQVL